MARLTDSDYQLFTEAMARCQAAQGTINFLRDMFAARYGLRDGDSINADGTIIRQGVANEEGNSAGTESGNSAGLATDGSESIQ